MQSFPGNSNPVLTPEQSGLKNGLNGYYISSGLLWTGTSLCLPCIFSMRSITNDLGVRSSMSTSHGPT